MADLRFTLLEQPDESWAVFAIREGANKADGTPEWTSDPDPVGPDFVRGAFTKADATTFMSDLRQAGVDGAATVEAAVDGV